MKLIPIIVECHSGFKTDEYPICFYWANIRFEIREIADRWYQTQITPDGPVANYFKVRAAGNAEYIIKHELKNDLWFLVSPIEPIIRFSSN
ncbi:MAG TPA: cytoplasmic protein [Prolixibacteraceae bacterium]|nr:cytoplasmic protein [Prolixibacteraceae bacterium]